MTTQSQPGKSPTRSARPKYPRRLGGRLTRFVLRVFWLIPLTAAVAVVAPNAGAIFTRSGIGGLTDPNHLLDLIQIPQVAPLTALSAQADLAMAIGIGTIFVLAVIAALLAGRDARRERRSVRALKSSGVAAAESTAGQASASQAPVPLVSTRPDTPPDASGWAPAPGSAYAHAVEEPAAAAPARSAEPASVPPPSQVPAGWAAVPADASSWYAPIEPASAPSALSPAAGIAVPAEAGASALSTVEHGATGASSPHAWPTSPRAAQAALSVPLAAWERARNYVGQLSQPLEVENLAVSPAPFAAVTPGWTPDRPVRERQLGEWVDGWADTVPGMADHAALMLEAFVGDMPTHLNTRTWAVSTRLGVTGLSTLAQGIDIPVSPRGVVRVLSSIGPGFRAIPRVILRMFGLDIIGRQRDYLFTAMTPGAAVGINISATGRDLYMAWDLFVRRVWNEVAVGLVALLALIVGAFAAWGAVNFAKAHAAATTGVLVGTFVGTFLAAAVFTVFACLAMGVFLGLASRGDPLALLVKRIDFFEGHDVQAMVLSVHKAMRAAADRAGVDVTLLRAKDEFRVERGRRGRVI